MSSAITTSDQMKGCGLPHAFKWLTLRYIRTITAGSPRTEAKVSKRRQWDNNNVSSASQKQTLAASALHHRKHYVAAARTPSHKNGVGGLTKEGDVATKINKHCILDGQKKLVRATSGNVMIYRHLGNLGGGGRGKPVCPTHVMDYLPRTAEESRKVPNGAHAVNDKTRIRSRNPNEKDTQTRNVDNDYRKNGSYKEALESNDSAALINQTDASFRISRIAALASSGQLLEAAHECRSALRINPRRRDVNCLLANLYIRLGESEKAMYHYKLAGLHAYSEELEKARALQLHLQKCTEAKKRRDWTIIVKETDLAIKSGAAFSPQIFSLQAEAYLKLRRHEEADIALSKATQFDVDACKKFYGPIGSANLLRIKAQVDMAAGRFDDALEAARKAEQLDPKCREGNMVAKKALAVALARSRGNDLFRKSKFSEAYEAYDEGLDRDPYISVLLCNRAACLFKLGQYQRAAKDCTAALNVWPSYDKARLRRADCNAKMGKWEEAIKDYRILLQKSPEDGEVKRAMARANFQLSKLKIREAARKNSIQR